MLLRRGIFGDKSGKSATKVICEERVELKLIRSRDNDQLGVRW